MKIKWLSNKRGVGLDRKATHATKAFSAEVKNVEDQKRHETYDVYNVIPLSRAGWLSRMLIGMVVLVGVMVGGIAAMSFSNAKLAANQTRHTTTVVTVSEETHAVVTLRHSEDTTVQKNAINTFFPEWLRYAREIAETTALQSKRVQSDKYDKCASPLFWLTSPAYYNTLIREINKTYPAFREEHKEGAIARVEIGRNKPQKLSSKEDWYYLDYEIVWYAPDKTEVLRKPRRVQARIGFEDREMPQCGIDVNLVGMFVQEAYFNDR